MSRVGLLLLALAASAVGIFTLLWILGSAGTDALDLIRQFGWWGVLIYLSWPLLMTVLAFHEEIRDGLSDLTFLFRRADAGTRGCTGAARDRRPRT